MKYNNYIVDTVRQGENLKYNILDIDGKLILASDFLGNEYNGYRVVGINNKFGYFDCFSNQFINLNAEYVGETAYTYSVVKFRIDKNSEIPVYDYTFFDTKTQKILPISYKFAEVVGNNSRIVQSKNDQWFVLENSGAFKMAKNYVDANALAKKIEKANITSL